jgi:hypothetical protein
LDEPFEIRNGEKVTGAEIVLSADGGEVTGVVKQENGEIARGATVVMFSADASRRGPRSRWTRMTQSDQQGSFRLAGVAPGEYLMCALQNHESGNESSTDYLKELEKDVTTVVVQARSRQSESLVMRPAPVLE